jgi:hypothetical protein
MQHLSYATNATAKQPHASFPKNATSNFTHRATDPNEDKRIRVNCGELKKHLGSATN